MHTQEHNKNQLSTSTTPTGSTNSEMGQAAVLVNKIFKSLKAIFPAWNTAVRDQETFNQMRAEWLKGLVENLITTDYQIEAGLSKARAHNSPFLPSIGQFIEWCKVATEEQYPPMEACYVEVQEFVRNGRRDTHNLNPFLYHVVVKNLDFYNFKKLEKEYDRVKALEIAYKATLFQLESGHQLITPPAPETLLESKPEPKYTGDPKDVKAAEATLNDIFKMLEPEPPKPAVENSIAKQRLQEAMEKLR